jgi:hypothetical protein
MKAALISTVIVSLILIESCGSSKQTVSPSGTSEEKFHSKRLTPVIDGKMNEWGDALLFDNTTKCIFAIANDDSALYIAIRAADRAQQMKIVQGGMEIWLDDKAKRKKSIGVKFPVGGGGMSMPAGRPGEGGQNAIDMRQLMKLKMLTMELTGFKEGLNGTRSVYSDFQVKPVIEWDERDNMVYELVIPFAVLDETVRTNLTNISIGIFIKGLQMEKSFDGMAAGRPPGGGPPGGGRSGGMRPGGGSMPDQGQMENMTKDDFFWTKYTIAKN